MSIGFTSMRHLKKAAKGSAEPRDQSYSCDLNKSRSVQALLAREVPVPLDRESIIRDVHLRLISSEDKFGGVACSQTFVYRQVQIAILRKRRSDRARLDTMVRLTFKVDCEEPYRVVPAEDYVYEIVSASTSVEKLLGTLPEPLLTAFRLRAIEKLGYEEIALRTNTPINTVAKRIFKGRELLARVFGGPASAP